MRTLFKAHQPIPFQIPQRPRQIRLRQHACYLDQTIEQPWRLTLRNPSYKYCSLLALLCAPTLAPAQSTQVCTATDADKPAVAKTVEDIFAAAQKDSTAAFDALVTPDYYMFDGGKRYDGHAIIDLIIDQHKKGYKYVWTVPAPDIEIGCNDAWIAYENAGSVTLPDGTKKDMKWLESAVLVKKNGQWLVRFFHSTRAA